MLLALLLAANLPGVTARPPVRAPPVSLEVAPEQHVCPAPLPVKDPSSAWFFATAPAARQDDHELAAGTLAALIDLRLVRDGLRLFILGTPTNTGVHFTNVGWKPRWPVC